MERCTFLSYMCVHGLSFTYYKLRAGEDLNIGFIVSNKCPSNTSNPINYRAVGQVTSGSFLWRYKDAHCIPLRFSCVILLIDTLDYLMKGKRPNGNAGLLRRDSVKRFDKEIDRQSLFLSPLTCCGTAALKHRAMERRSGPILAQETGLTSKVMKMWGEITQRSAKVLLPSLSPSCVGELLCMSFF